MTFEERVQHACCAICIRRGENPYEFVTQMDSRLGQRWELHKEFTTNLIYALEAFSFSGDPR